MSAKKPAPVVDRRSQRPSRRFEKAMKALGKHDYDRAREHLRRPDRRRIPEERDLLERARVLPGRVRAGARRSGPPSGPRPSRSS